MARLKRHGLLKLQSQNIVALDGKVDEIRMKMNCVFRLEKWILIDSRRMGGCLGGVWKEFFAGGGCSEGKIEST